MTVATDLQLRSGVSRRLFLRIDGLPYDFWQPHEVSAPSYGAEVAFGSLVNTSASTNSITRTTGGTPDTWDSGGASTSTITEGWVDFRNDDVANNVAGGLSSGNADATLADIDFAWMLTNVSGGTAYIYENGTLRLDDGAYVATDEFRVELVGGVVRYYKNGAFVYESAGSPTGDMLFDCSIHTVGGSIVDVVMHQAGEWRTPLECLDLGGEVSNGLDIRELKADSGAIAFQLRNIYNTSLERVGSTNDQDETYLLPQLFATGRASGGHTAHLRSVADEVFVLHSASTIYCDINTDFDATGTAYIGGREAFTYTGRSLHSAPTSLYKFTGVTKGVYPAVGTSAFGQAFRIDPNAKTGSTLGLPVTQYPLTYFGRQIALYVVTLQGDGTWPAFSAAEMLWSGSINHEINYDAQRGAYELSCVSLLSWLEQVEVGTGITEGHIRGYNLLGPDRLGLSGEVRDSSGTVAATFSGSVAAGWYETLPSQLVMNVICDQNNWSVATYAPSGGGGGIDSEGVLFMEFGQSSLGGAGRTYKIWATDVHNIALQAIGYPFEFEWTSAAPGAYVTVAGERPAFKSFHPLERRCNGGYLYTDLHTTQQIASQGDQGVTRGYCLVGPVVALNGREEEPFIAAYTGDDGGTYLKLTLDAEQPYSPWPRQAAGHAWHDEPSFVKQVYYSESRVRQRGAWRGPFEALLHPLLSTGTQAADNGVYDTMPPQFAVGLNSSLVDTQSFLDADALISTDALADRRGFLQLQSPTEYFKLLHRECKLFGYFLVQSRGQLSLKPLAEPGTDTYVETLDASTNAQIIESPKLSWSTGACLNKWIVKPIYSTKDDDYVDRKFIFVDQDSVDALREAYAIEIEHPGLYSSIRYDDGLKDGWLTSGLRPLFDRKAQVFRLPLPRVDVTLGPVYANRIAIGDVVRWQSTQHPDPFGSGTMSLDCLAMVVDYEPSWGGEMGWTARVGLLVFANADRLLVTPWAPGALVELGETSWVSGGPYFTCVPRAFGVTGDNEDGEAFNAGDIVRCIWTHPTDPTAGQEWAGLEVDYYDAATHRLYLTGSPAMTGYDFAREYVIVPDDWDQVTTAQQALALFQADETTMKLDGDLALRYG